MNAAALFDIFAESGFPPGVVNLVTASDPAEVGEELLTNPTVRKITFTGSTTVGKYLAKRAAEQVKNVSLELGGHAPFLIFADADPEQAADGVIASKFRNAGQTCVCANRIYVEASIQEKFAEILAEKVRALKVGNGMDPKTDIGPLIDRAAVEKSRKHVEDAVQKGARLVCGGKPVPEGESFFEPTVLTGVTEEMLVCSEETFGPVLPVMTFQSEAEAIRRANDTPYGLAAYFYTNDLGRAFRVAEKLEYGIVGLNDPLPSAPEVPFGGYKQSGIGREGGKEGIEAFLETKYVSMKIRTGE